MKRPILKLPVMALAALSLSSCSLLNAAQDLFVSRVEEAIDTQKLVLRSTPQTELRFDEVGLTQVIRFEEVTRQRVSRIERYEVPLFYDHQAPPAYEPSEELVANVASIVSQLRGRQDPQPPVFMNIPFELRGPSPQVLYQFTP